MPDVLCGIERCKLEGQAKRLSLRRRGDGEVVGSLALTRMSDKTQP
jgi:hypothetical protein